MMAAGAPAAAPAAAAPAAAAAPPPKAEAKVQTEFNVRLLKVTLSCSPLRTSKLPYIS
jgi:hypothetical protein